MEIEFYGNLQSVQTLVERWPHGRPLKLPLSAPKRRNGQWRDAPFPVMGLKIIQAFNEVAELREAPPVLLRREVQYPRRHQAFVEVGSPRRTSPRCTRSR